MNRLTYTAGALALITSPVTWGDPGSMMRPDSHAPASVMADHAHAAGGAMVGYRYINQSYSGYRQGEDRVSNSDLVAMGYTMATRRMDMDMQMLDIMYAPTDTLTLMVMPMYMSMDMSMVPLGTPMGHGEDMATMGHMDSMTMSTDMMTDGMSQGMMMHNMAHQHGTSGWGDTALAALYSLPASGDHKAHITLAVTAPTGSVTEKNAAGLLTHYGMQLGSGTWDFTPNITYTGHSDRLGWGAQMDAIIRLEDENEVGFAFGNQYGVNGWLSFLATDWLSTSLRLRYSHEDAISGGYDEPASSMSPADNPDNYGGEFWEIGVGVNLVSPSGWSKGLRVGLEWIDIFSADYNGVQLAQDDNLQVNVSYAF